MDVLIVGAGIGGLTLALSLHRAGIPCRVFEAAHEIRPLGVGINLLPHAMRELVDLGLETEIAACGIETREVSFFNRFGQHIFTEPRGRFAGYDWPQYSIHRALSPSTKSTTRRRRSEFGSACECDAFKISFKYPPPRLHG